MNLAAITSLALVLCLSQGKEAMPVEKPSDHESLDTLVAALYDVISGPAEQKRDWKRFQSLFHDGARMQAMVMGRDGKRRLITMTPKEYVERSGKWAEANGMFEKETHRTQDVYGSIAQVFSTYELRIGDPDKEPDLTGINSIQCCRVDGKWRILSTLWEDARSAGPIPDRYRAGPKQETPAGSSTRPAPASGAGGPKKEPDDRK